MESQARGVVPVISLNFLTNWDELAKPESAAMSSNESSGITKNACVWVYFNRLFLDIYNDLLYLCIKSMI